VETGFDTGAPVTLIAEAVFARTVSSLKDERVAASKVLKGPGTTFSGDKATFIQDVRNALYASKIISYAQGYMLMKQASKEFKWDLNLGGIALMWRGGCIIRSRFLGDIKKAYDKNPELSNLLLDTFFTEAIEKGQASWRRVVSQAILLGIPTPTFSTALAFYDGFRTANLPANLLQGQRDYFGAHTYERIDKPRGEFFHTNWTGRGGNVTSNSYNV
jgi:6-phosphogluconate dehydrogenase